MADHILETVQADADTTFLEPGVGTGNNVLPLVRRGYAVAGTEVSPAMLEQFRRKLGKAAPNLTLILHGAPTLPFLEASYDVVLTVHMLQTLPDWRAFLAEIARVLKPEGTYLYGQYLMPPHRRDVEALFQDVLKSFRPPSTPGHSLDADDVQSHLLKQGAEVSREVVTSWTVTETVQSLLRWYEARAFGSCWAVSEGVFQDVMQVFRRACEVRYGSLTAPLSSPVSYEMMASRW